MIAADGQSDARVVTQASAQLRNHSHRGRRGDVDDDELSWLGCACIPHHLKQRGLHA